MLRFPRGASRPHHCSQISPIVLPFNTDLSRDFEHRAPTRFHLPREILQQSEPDPNARISVRYADVGIGNAKILGGLHGPREHFSRMSLIGDRRIIRAGRLRGDDTSAGECGNLLKTLKHLKKPVF